MSVIPLNSRQLALQILVEWERSEIYAADLIEKLPPPIALIIATPRSFRR